MSPLHSVYQLTLGAVHSSQPHSFSSTGNMVRVKRRHSTIVIIPNDSSVHDLAPIALEEREIVQALKNAIQSLHGDYGLGTCLRSLAVKKYCPSTRTAVVSTQRGPHILLLTSLPLVRKIGKHECTLRLARLSGTLRSSYKSIMKKNPPITSSSKKTKAKSKSK